MQLILIWCVTGSKARIISEDFPHLSKSQSSSKHLLYIISFKLCSKHVGHRTIKNRNKYELPVLKVPLITLSTTNLLQFFHWGSAHTTKYLVFILPTLCLWVLTLFSANVDISSQVWHKFVCPAKFIHIYSLHYTYFHYSQISEFVHIRKYSKSTVKIYEHFKNVCLLFWKELFYYTFKCIAPNKFPSSSIQINQNDIIIV